MMDVEIWKINILIYLQVEREINTEHILQQILTSGELPRLLLNAKWVIYHGENKIHFYEMMDICFVLKM